MKVKFLPQNVEHEIEFNETVLHLAQRHDIHIQSVCKGLPSCAECRVRIKEGEHHVPPPSSKELSLIGTAYYIDQSRLSCQLRCFGDLVVDLTEQIEKESRVSKRPQGRGAKADGEESQAVKGNIIEEYKEEGSVVGRVNPKEERPGVDSFYDSFQKDKDDKRKPGGRDGGRGGRGRDRNRNRGPGRGQQPRAGGSSDNRGPRNPGQAQQGSGNSTPGNQGPNNQGSANQGQSRRDQNRDRQGGRGGEARASNQNNRGQGRSEGRANNGGDRNRNRDRHQAQSPAPSEVPEADKKG